MRFQLSGNLKIGIHMKQKFEMNTYGFLLKTKNITIFLNYSLPNFVKFKNKILSKLNEKQKKMLKFQCNENIFGSYIIK